jgi:hypothetical protein
MIMKTFCLVFVLLVAGICAGITRYVSEDGHNIPPYTNWYDAATWIQPALSISIAGDTILVTNDMYFIDQEMVVSNGITIRSVYSTNYVTIWVVNNPVRVFRLLGDCRISGFLFRSGEGGTHGGAVYCYDHQPVVSNCIFFVNRADYGGGAYRGTMNNCKFILNEANYHGGGTYESILNNCQVTDNIGINGAGIFGGTANNCTIAGNAGDNYGGGVCSGVVNNCIVYYNTATTGANLYHSTAQYTCSPGLSGNGNIGGAPQFINHTSIPGNYRLHATSPCINAGTNVYAPMPVDVEHLPRIIGGVVDMGAHEYPLPVLHITNQFGLVPYETSSVSIDGTNNEVVVGAILWANLTSGATGSVTRHSTEYTAWTGEVQLQHGDNAVRVTGENIYGVTSNDTVHIHRETYLEYYVYIGITSAPAKVSYFDTTAQISGTNVNVAGNLWWINDRHPGDRHPFTPGFSVTIDNLEQGDNVITIYGTNAHHHATNDSVIIYRHTFSEGYAYIDITNAPATVLYADTTAGISGTNVNIHADLWWGNDRHPGVYTMFSPGFNTTVHNLEQGDNLITVYGTNTMGHATNDNVVIHRETFAEGYVYRDITNEPPQVDYDETTTQISGTNVNISGNLWWENDRHPGDIHNFSPGFMTTVNNLDHGDNVITVFGENTGGHATSDTVVIHRKTYEEAVPQIDTNALLFPVAGSLLEASEYTNIIWDPVRIHDDTDGINLTITRIRVLRSNDLSEAALVVTNIANTAGFHAWLVEPELMTGQTAYVLQFDVINSSSLTNNRIFRDYAFRVVPEPFAGIVVLGMLAGCLTRRRVPE